MKIPLGAGSPITLASGQSNPSVGGLNTDTGIAVDGTNVYWTNFGGGAVMKVPVSGGVPIVVAQGQNPLGVAIDGTSVYWTDYGNATVMKTPK
jgi:hypothetical protein